MKIKVKDFNLEATLNSGQVFGFLKRTEGIYEGAIAGTHIRLSQKREILQVEENGNKISKKLVRTYFDLDYDLTSLYQLLCEDDRLKPIYERFKGLRIIRQNPWEALACFIISSNNNIKRIQGIRKNLSRAFSSSNFLFPEARNIASSDEHTLRSLGLGYRAPFLLWAAKHVLMKANIFNQIRKSTYERAKARLMEFPGIGEKVADCVLLFGFQKHEAFPVDVWIARAVQKLYFRNRKVSERTIQEFGRKRWGRYAGYVQQYLYHGAKNGVLGL